MEGKEACSHQALKKKPGGSNSRRKSKKCGLLGTGFELFGGFKSAIKVS
jgi:hypothetical protein